MNEFAFYMSSGKPFSKHTRVQKDVIIELVCVYVKSNLTRTHLAVVD